MVQNTHFLANVNSRSRSLYGKGKGRDERKRRMDDAPDFELITGLYELEWRNGPYYSPEVRNAAESEPIWMKFGDL